MRGSSFFGRSLSGCLVVAALSLIAACSNPRRVSCLTECNVTQMCCAPGAATTGICVNHLIDPANCGSCGHACLAGQACITGTCSGVPTDGARPDSGSGLPDSGTTPGCTASPSCAAGFMCCGPRCIDADGIPTGDGRADMSFDDCGVCGVMCDEATASRCGRARGASSGRPMCYCGDFSACTAPRQCMIRSGEFRCVDPLHDDDACGDGLVNCTLNNETCDAGVCSCAATGTTCAPLLCGASGCIDTDTDEANCGMAGHACAAGETCNGGTCGCGTGGPCAVGGGFPPGMCGETCCADHCVPVSMANCGGCGVACTGGDLCQTGFLMPGVSCMPDGAPFAIPCEEPPPGPDAGTSIDAATDPDAGADAATDDAASDPDAGVDAGP
jgi:hypothetical protein